MVSLKDTLKYQIKRKTFILLWLLLLVSNYSQNFN